MKKQYKIPLDLFIMLAWTILMLIFVLTPTLNETFIRVALGLPMVLFIPGYVLIAALFPKNNELGGTERLTLSFGLSIAVVPLLGLFLNFTFGIKQLPILLTLYLYNILLIIIAASRRGRLPEEERFSVPFYKVLDTINYFKKTRGKIDMILTVILIFLAVSAIGMVYYVITTPKIGERFTEFYILDQYGKAENYSTRLTNNSPVPVLVGVVNHEYMTINYTVEVALDNKVIDDTRLSLDNNQTWEKNMIVIPDKEGTDMKLEFRLFKEDNFTAPYRQLHLWVNVTE